MYLAGNEQQKWTPRWKALPLLEKTEERAFFYYGEQKERVFIGS
jgi:hypothetical protein